VLDHVERTKRFGALSPEGILVRASLHAFQDGCDFGGTSGLVLIDEAAIARFEVAGVDKAGAEGVHQVAILAKGDVPQSRSTIAISPGVTASLHTHVARLVPRLPATCRAPSPQSPRRDPARG
jgi:hypothetical protein